MATDIIFFDGSGVDPEERPELESVLGKLTEAGGPDPWGRPPIRIEVRRKLSGLGGATVLDLLVCHRRRDFVVVIKVDTAENTRREYQAYRAVVEPAGGDLCPPIVAATPGVADPIRAHPREREAIVYQHVAQFVGEPATALTTLEDVFERASLGDGAAARRATAAVAGVSTRARQVFHTKPEIGEATSLKELVDTLGPDITVEADAVGAAGTDLARPIFAGQILAAGTGHRDGSGEPVAVGDHVLITGLHPVPGSGGLTGGRDGATVAVLSLAPGDPDDGAGPTFDVSGRVVRTRPQTVLGRLGGAIESLREGDGVIEAAGVIAAHPYAGLHRALLTERLPAVRSAIHGDLNSRNVLLVDSPHAQAPSDRPYVIDYARADKDKHLLTDFAWLELNLMRACGGSPGLANLVRLQRTLTVAAALFALADADDRAIDAPVTAVAGAMEDLLHATAPGLAAGWPVLARLRWEAWRSYPPANRVNWFADYNRHLTLAAHRTFKWPDAQQTPVRLAASTAVACVAAEWRDPGSALRHWSDDDLTALAGALPPALARAGAQAVWAAPVLGAVTAEIHHRRAAGPARWDLPGVSVALATAARALAAAALRPSLRPPARRPLIDLAAEPCMGVAAAGDDVPPEERVSAVTALAREDFAVLIGSAGAGKTTVVEMLVDRMLDSLTRPGHPQPDRWHRIPVVIPARDLVTAPADLIPDVVAAHAPVASPTPGHVHDLLRAGCLHLMVDGITGAAEWPAITTWTDEVRRQYPRVPVLACGRSAPVGTGWDLPVYRLLPPTMGQAIGYLVESAALDSLPVRRVRGVLTGDPRLADGLLDSPMFLGLLAAHLRPDTGPLNVADLLDRHFARPPAPGDEQNRGSGESSWDDARRMAGAFAAHLVDLGIEGSDAEKPDGAGPLSPDGPVSRDWLEPPDHAGWPAARELLVASGVLTVADTGLAFTRPVYRDYFAAIDLAHRPGLLADRARRLAWREPLCLAVSRRDGAPDLLATVLPVVRCADPAFAGRLLAAAAVPPADLDMIPLFVSEQDRILRDPSAGDSAWERASAALATLGVRGVELLCAAVGDPTRSVGARLAGMRALLGAGPLRGAAADALTGLLGGLLADAAEQPELRVAAVRCAADRGAAHLAVLIADGCGPEASWPYRRAAHAALERFGVPLPETARARYRSAAADRLAELDALLPTLTVAQQIDSAQHERLELLRRTFTDDLDRLLALRFAFEIGDEVRLLLDRLPGSALDGDDRAVWLLRRASADEALAQFGAADDRCAVAAAHRLYKLAPERADALVEMVRPGDRPARLLVAAAVASRPAHLPHLESLARGLLADDRDRVGSEALAALTQAVTRLDPVRGGHLAEYIHATLGAVGDPARLRWPVRSVLARCTPGAALWGRLLTGTAEDRALGIAALSAPGFHLEAAAPPPRRLEPVALRALESATPAPVADWAAVDFVRAAATARLTGALRLVLDLLDLTTSDTMIREVGYRGYGILTLAARSEVLSAGGFLARHALIEGDHAAGGVAAAVAERIRTLDTGRAHPSVAAGRLIALAYLGDPGQLLTGLDTVEPRLHTAARHAVLDLAAAGPYTPATWRDPDRAREMVAEMHAGARTPQARTTLQGILDELSVRTGRLPAPRAAATVRCA